MIHLADLPALLGIFLYTLIAAVILSRRRLHPRLAPALFFYSLLGAAWSGWQFAANMSWLRVLQPGFVAGVMFNGVLLLALVLLAVSRAFLYRKSLEIGWWIFGIAWLAVVIILQSDLLPLRDVLWQGLGLQIKRLPAAFAFLLIGWAGLNLVVVDWSFSNQRQESSPIQRNRITYWAIGLALTISGEAFFLTGQWLVGTGLRLMGNLVIGYGLLTIRLLNLGRQTRWAVSLLVVTGITVMFYVGAFLLAQLLLSGLSLVAASFLFAVLVALLLNPLVHEVQRRMGNWIAGKEQDHSQVIRQYSQSITNVLDLKLLATVLVGAISEALEASRGFLFLVNQDKSADGQIFYTLRGEVGMGDTGPQMGWLAEKSPLIDFFRYDFRPLMQEEVSRLSRFSNLAPNEREWLVSLATEVYFPIHAKSEWIGLLALGSKQTGEPYSGDELSLIALLADQTAVALENVRLIDSLTRLNNEFQKAYAQLDQANAHLERLDRTKSDFISIASHELRTPLTVISGSSQMLLDEPTFQENPYYRQLLTKIQSGTTRMHEIVESLLDMAQIDTRVLQLEPQPISIDDLIHSTCDNLTQVFAERKQTLEIDDLSRLPAVEADVEALRKVFKHLVMNAIKYTPDGGKITISGKKVHPNMNGMAAGGVEVVVADTGIGIDPKFKDLVFVKFYQTGELALHSTGKTKFKGAGPGLGLAITKGIIEAHGGEVWVESAGYDEEKCPGSRFHVVIPVRQTTSLINTQSEK
ncbi:MAG TPA: GAF domain-containing sensor histidine kinase [Anaerolineales bacterium]|nr:GAF domain-containing sensor histidine kinase [Anaerolineales bacterium]